MSLNPLEGNNDRGIPSNMVHTLVRILSRQKKGLSLCHFNAQSLRNRIDELRYICEGSNVDLVCISETWFDKDTSSNVFKMHGYKLFRADRASHAGGVAVYIKQNLKCKVICSSGVNDLIEFIFIEIIVAQQKTLLGCAYRPNNNICFEPLLNIIANLSSNYADIILTGDLNSNILKDKSLIDSLLSLDLHPVNVTIPTHYNKHSPDTLIDVIFVNDESKILLYDQISAPQFSRHDMLFLTYKHDTVCDSDIKVYRDFRHIDFSLLKQATIDTNWSQIFHLGSLDQKAQFLEDRITYLFDSFVPVVKKPLKHRKQEWFNTDIEKLISFRDAAYARWKRFRTPDLYSAYKELRRRVVKEIKTAKKNFYTHKLNSCNNSKERWNMLRILGIGKSVKNVDDDVDLNNLNQSFLDVPASAISFQQCSHSSTHTSNTFYFENVESFELLDIIFSIKSNAVGADGLHPAFIKIIIFYILPFVKHVINSVLTSSRYPIPWKKSKIIPLPKSATEYRPIAIQPFFSKVCELVIKKQITKFLNSNNMLSLYQSGFRPKHSCVTAVINVAEDLRIAMDDNMVSILVLLDHTKAFNSIERNIMHTKLLSQFAFSSSAADLILSYLSDRTQAVFANSSSSTFLEVSRGVPQGSVIGPLLFSMYINDLPDVLKFCEVHMYADDVQLYAHCRTDDLCSGVHRINEDLERLAEWANSNSLCVNPRKSKAIILHRRQVNLNNIPRLKILNDDIEFVESAKNLGLTIDERLSWDKHISLAVGKCYGQLRLLNVVRSVVPQNIKLMLAKTMLFPQLLYGCEIFANCGWESAHKLNVLYNNIVRFIFNKKPFESVSVYEQSVFGITLPKLLKVRSLILLHKTILSKEPYYLYKKIRFMRSKRGRRIIPHRHFYLFSERQFFIYAVRAWNSLPLDVQIINDVQEFRNRLYEIFKM